MADADTNTDDDVFTFRDVKPTQDIYHLYNKSIQNGKPIIIDHGIVIK